MKGDIRNYFGKEKEATASAKSQTPQKKKTPTKSQMKKEEPSDSEDEIIGYKKRTAAAISPPVKLPEPDTEPKRRKLRKASEEEKEVDLSEAAKKAKAELEKAQKAKPKATGKRTPKKSPAKPKGKAKKVKEEEEWESSGTELLEGDESSVTEQLEEEPSVKKPERPKRGESKEEAKRKKSVEETKKKPVEETKKRAAKSKPTAPIDGGTFSDNNLLFIDLPLAGKTFVITGQLDNIKREDLVDVLKQLGGKVTGSVSTRTSYLIAGNVLEDGRKVETSSKYKKAVQLKTPILAETDLEDLLQKATKNPNFTLVQAKAFLQGKETEVKETKPAEEIIKEKAEADGNKLWADKYAPESTTEIVGNTATINKLKEWIHDWEKVVLEGQKKPIVFRPGMSRDNIVNVNARACLLSGPPGIGKSTAAVLCAKEEGYDVVETNASDHRNKKIIEQLLSDAVGNEAITMYSSESDRKKLKIGKKTIVVMDEVDGVSGNNDRGGIQALIKIIKTTKTPIICICNDRQSQKVRSLANHCYDLKFIRPQNATIKNRLKIILSAEKVHMDDNALELLIESAGNDIRQMINMLQLHSSTQKSTTFLQAKDQLRFISKDAESMVNPFEAATKLLNQRESREFRMNKKMSLYFIDFELMPLLVQENYLTSYGQNQTLKDVQDMAESADYISLGDCMNRTLREENEWTLLPDVGLCSTIAPTTISARIPVFVRFPTWFGKNSTIKKTKRLIHELANAMAGKVSVPQDALLNDIIPYLLSETVKKLMDGEAEEAIAILNEFRITLDMFKENVLDLCENTKWENKYKNLDPHTKSAFTRVYHKLHPDIVTKKKKKKGDEEEIKDKIDPDIESVKDAMEKSEEAEEEEEEEIVIVPTKSTKGTKARKKETKKATGEKKARTPKKESKKRAGKKGKGTKEKEENLPGFIVEDEEE